MARARDHELRSIEGGPATRIVPPLPFLAGSWHEWLDRTTRRTTSAALCLAALVALRAHERMAGCPGRVRRVTRLLIPLGEGRSPEERDFWVTHPTSKRKRRGT